ncbi:hypothetical protein DPMN_194798 [Dreissena polymorpha]|uniref:Uncharacterized protein n=1 Tax=Dreissena polymorpha TaxID=45954 RepID=A0A9D3Y5I7_DREPO|nr:hypothetical protein DPMN_194798 [Dreissena polymorpha]
MRTRLYGPRGPDDTVHEDQTIQSMRTRQYGPRGPDDTDHEDQTIWTMEPDDRDNEE